MLLDYTQQTFLLLVRAGLWEDIKDNGERLAATVFPLNFSASIDWHKVYKIADEQSVLGLITAGLEQVKELNIPSEEVLQFIGQSLQIEQQNIAMNKFVAKLIGNLRKNDIYTLLVKGAGIAQCYNKPLWRICGDVDLLLSDTNYQKAKTVLSPLSICSIPERNYSKELGLTIDSYLVELHGSLRTGLSSRVDIVVDNVQKDVFYGGSVRSWNNGGTSVFLPAPDNDVFFIFTHFIKHFYKEGMCLRQVCDWCRLLWIYRNQIDAAKLNKWVEKSGLMCEWKAFAVLAVEYLGMPKEAMPFYDIRRQNDEVRSKKLVEFILKGYTGNTVKDTYQIAKIFPWKVFLYSPSIFLNVNWLKIKERLFKNEGMAGGQILS